MKYTSPDSPAADNDGRSVSGRVLLKDGRPLAGARVVALRKDIKSEKPLGNADTDAEGRYEIRYAVKDAERLDLIVRVGEKGKEAAVSAVVFNAKPQEVVDLTSALEGAPLRSEYERLEEALAPLSGGVPPAELTPEQTAYLKGASGIPGRLVGRFILAAKAAEETKLSAPLFYALFRGGHPLSLDGILGQPQTALADALSAGFKNRLIPGSLKKEAEPFLDGLRRLMTKKAFETPTAEGRASLGEVLSSAPSLNREKAEELLRQYAEHKGPAKNFWEGLRRKPAFKGAVEEVQFSVQAGVLTGNHLPLIDSLQGLRTSGKIDGWKDLAAWDAAEWKAFLTRRNGHEAAGAPKDVPGKTPAERLDNYAAGLARRLEEAYPTEAIAARLANSDAPRKKHLGAFFGKNPDFALDRRPVSVYLKETPKALDAVPEKERDAVVKELKTLQRLSRITPHYDEIAVLSAGGVTSAQSAVYMGRDAFATQFGDALGGTDRANEVYWTAEQRYGMALNMMTLLDPNLNFSLAVLPTSSGSMKDEIAKDMPDWESLFGSQDACECAHCRSVLSPAAYLTDVLHFLMDRAAGGGQSAKDVLFKRRPDLGEIELSCENANTPLPYVDLTNEILEEAVSSATAVPARQRQTRSSAGELAANPEHPNPGAYDELRSAVFPWGIPFDLWTEEIRVYLSHLGVERLELMKALFPKTGGAPEAAAGEALGLNDVERDVITRDHADANKPWKYWGLSSGAGWANLIGSVREILKRSGLRFEDFENLLKRNFINPTGAAKVTSTDPLDAATCDTAKLALSGSTLTNLAWTLDRLMRFTRLQRHLGWTARELDAAVSAFQPVDINRDSLRSLAAIDALRSRFGLEVDEVLAWYAPIGTTAAEEGETKCLYERLFQNPAVIKRAATDPDPFALNNPRTELKTVGGLRDPGVVAALSAALGLSNEDLSLLIDGRAAPDLLDPAVTAGKQLNRENLSRLFRAASLSRALGLSVEEFLRARALIPVDPFVNGGGAVTPDRIEATLEFARKADKARASGATFGDIDFLLRHRGSAGGFPVDEDLSAFLVELRTALNAVGQDMQAETVAQKLADRLKLDAAAARYLVKDWPDRPAAAAHRLTDVFLDAAFWDATSAIDETRYPGLFEALRRLHKIAGLATSLRLTADELVWTAKNASALGWLSFASIPTAAGQPAASFEGWERLAGFFLWEKDLPSANVSFVDVLDKAVTFTGAAGAAKQAVMEAAAAAAGWPLEDMETLLGAKNDAANTGLLKYAFPADHRDERTWLRVSRIFELITPLGASAQQGADWAKAAPDAAAGRAAREKAKSKHDANAWLALAKPLRDALREKQRAALVDYLAARPDPARGRVWEDANGLYAYFLIDVEMCSCMLTSRLKQAAASVQLFVQRCLMNLEHPQVKADAKLDAAWLQWKWMKTYRVWEANRKVFLWPENWIEPDLRDDKSLFFREMEQDLLQNDITTETAEAAFLNYVDKLDQVSRLEVRGVYNDEERKFLHVFGRTVGQPNFWYYRRREDTGLWTAWEKLELDIQSGQVLPVLWDGRLRVIWPVVTEETKPDADLSITPGQSVGKPAKIWKVQLAWSERNAAGRWSPKRVTPETLAIPASMLQFKIKEGVELMGSVSSTGLAVEVRLNDSTGGVYSSVGKFVFSPGILEPKVSELGNPYTFIPGTSGSGLAPYSTIVDRISSLIPKEAKKVDGRAVEMVKELAGSQGDGSFSLVLLNPESSGTPSQVQLLAYTPGVYRLSFPHQYGDFQYWRPFFYQDDGGTFLVEPKKKEVLQSLAGNADEIDLESLYGAANGDVVYLNKVATAEPAAAGAGGGGKAYHALKAMKMVIDGGAGDGGGGGQKEVPEDGDGGDDTAPVSTSYASTAVGTSHGGGGLISVDPVYHTLDEKLEFKMFHHPFCVDFGRQLRTQGLDGLLQRDLQLQRRETFAGLYDPEYWGNGGAVAKPYPVEEVDFSHEGANSLYNWEIFFHAPLLIADRLSKNQKFEDAQRWFHFIFDPTDASSEGAPQKFWRTRKFFETSKPDYVLQEIRRLLQNLASGTPDPELEKQVAEWRKNPFKPHAIARLRTVAYQKTVVMKYIDNLIGWGDKLFGQATIETINEATQLYVLAAEILGRKPERMKPRLQPPAFTFNELASSLKRGDFSDPAVALEGFVVPGYPMGDIGAGSKTMMGANSSLPPSVPRVLAFCVPRNEKLLDYWRIVGERLFNIRHCKDIRGQALQLPLFEPPIDPALLVQAAAAGVDLSDAVAGAAAPSSSYRFGLLIDKASAFCAEVKALGAALLSALEKRDAEGLALLRSSQEVKAVSAVRQVREKQVDDAEASLDALLRAGEVITLRRDFYRDIAFMNTWEKTQVDQLQMAQTLEVSKISLDALQAVLFFIPNIKIGAPTSMGATYGGDNVGNAMKAISMMLGSMAAASTSGATLNGTQGGHQRRFDEWKLQESLADKELEQSAKQIASARIRLAIAKAELANHDLQADNAKDADAFMRDKYTNQELYNWMTGQIASVYFQSYKLAFDMARRAEKAYRFELGLETSDFMQPAYWDSLKKGLLSGEKLHHDLKRMEADFLDKNVREYELTKTVSLAMTDPAALVKLKQTGECFFDLPEALYDMDHPGHFFRRLKSVALSVPCVAGPYQGVHATLTLQPNAVIRKTNATATGADPYGSSAGGGDRFTTTFTPARDAIATSTGREDRGLFDANLRDERYLPFEGAGAESRWRLVMDKDVNRFDFASISDVVLHVLYTAREGGDGLRGAAKTRLAKLERATADTTLARLMSLKAEFSDGWHRFLNPADTDAAQSIVLDLTDRLPAGTKLAKVDLFLKVKDSALPAGNTLPADVPMELRAGATGTGANLLNNKPLQSEAALNKMHHVSITLAAPAAPGAWLLRATGASLPAFIKKTARVNNVDYPHLDPDKVEDVFLALRLVAP